MIYIDTETTGFDPLKDDILSIAIIDDGGKILLDTLLSPTRKTAWPDAMRVNQITPEMVKGKPTIASFKEAIEDAFFLEDVCAYNADFDFRMLAGNGINWRMNALGAHCCMERWAVWKGVPSTKHYHKTGYLTHKLTVAADEIGYKWTGRAHGALADAQACRAVWQWLDKAETATRFI